MPTPVIIAALFGRFASRGNADYANRVLSAMRKQFGGHDEKKKTEMGHTGKAVIQADALELFDITGGLARKKIFPALYALTRRLA